MKKNITPQQLCLIIILVILFIRLISMALIPLSDSTESRYANIARIMVETNNWITPQIEPGVPFWAKPPLSTWLSAISYKILGINEFAARLPSFILGLLVIGLTYRMAYHKNSRACAVRAMTLLTAMPVFLVSFGAVMTDLALLSGVTLSLTSFGIVMTTSDNKRLWGYLFFSGIAIGIISKGPIAVILVGIPTFLWTLLEWKWRSLWSRFPWITGLLFMLVISVPWFILAEKRTPGFLDYFIIGEHWKRFTVHGWSGDLYGKAHSMPLGIIWALWIPATMPWGIVFIYAMRNRISRSKLKIFWLKQKEWNLYLLLCILSPLLFFTLSANILWTYVLPGIPAFAILLSSFIENQLNDNPDSEWIHTLINYRIPTLALYIVLLSGLALIPASMPMVTDKISQRNIVNSYYKTRSSNQQRLIYLCSKPFSADFYSDGKAYEIEDFNIVKQFVKEPGNDYYITRKLNRIPNDLYKKLCLQAKFGRYYLFKENSTR